MGRIESLASLFLIFILLSLWTQNPWLLAGGLGLFVLGLLSPSVAEILGGAYAFLTELVFKAVTFTLLVLIYFCVLTPLALIRNFLHASENILTGQGKESQFTERNQKFTASDFENPW